MSFARNSSEEKTNNTSLSTHGFSFLIFQLSFLVCSMQAIEVVILLLIIVVALSVFARRLNIVFPVLLTLAGLFIGFIPGIPEIVLDPSVVLLVFLPPVLYSAAWYTNWQDFKRNLEPITVLALGLVIATSITIAYTAQAFLPGFTLAMGFLLGSIISPPDAVAATSVLKRVSIPKKIVTVLEGESLVNDASALIVFQFALAAVSTGTFSITQASGKFLFVVTGGILIGFLIGYLAYLIHRRFTIEPALETMFTFVTAYGAYLAAEQLHLNGVLSVVTAGLFMGSKQSRLHSPAMRIQAIAVWDFVIVFINGLIFILIGLQLPHLIKDIQNQDIPHLIWYGFIISIAATVIRFVYVFIADTISDRARDRLKIPRVFPSIKHTTVLAFTSMRGVVSLAAAFSIPVAIEDGTAFPQRDLILFVAFCVVVFTLVLQGLTLPALIRILKFEKDPNERKRRYQVRHQLSETAFKKIEHIMNEENIQHEIARKIKDWHYQKLVHHININDEDTIEEKQVSQKLQLASIAARREKLFELKDAGEIETELFHELENDLDLEEARIKKN
jgi:CPA1 family monovalent cation:H+ antiporter